MQFALLLLWAPYSLGDFSSLAGGTGTPFFPVEGGTAT